MANSSGTLQTSPIQADHLVRQLRQLLGLTQEQFAAHMGVTLPTVNRWENNRSKPSPLALLRLKTMLDELSRSPIEALRVRGQELLAGYFED